MLNSRVQSVQGCSVIFYFKNQGTTVNVLCGLFDECKGKGPHKLLEEALHIQLAFKQSRDEEPESHPASTAPGANGDAG